MARWEPPTAADIRTLRAFVASLLLVSSGTVDGRVGLERRFRVDVAGFPFAADNARASELDDVDRVAADDRSRMKGLDGWRRHHEQAEEQLGKCRDHVQYYRDSCFVSSKPLFVGFDLPEGLFLSGVSVLYNIPTYLLSCLAKHT